MTEIEKMRREQLQKECRNITGNFEEIGFLIGVESVYYACARNKEDYEEFSSCCPTIFTSTSTWGYTFFTNQSIPMLFGGK